MFGIGLPELILIMGLALIVVGPDKLPGLAKTVAKQILELKKAANSLKESLDEELKEEKESLQELAAPLNELDVRLPDFDEMHGSGIVPDPPDPVVDAVAASEPAVVVDDASAGDTSLPVDETETETVAGEKKTS
jgi:sec-independent protein translocase protein TatB